MMSRFTEKAQEALQRAQQIMFAKQHTQLDVEHIFLALLQQRNSLPAMIITQSGGDVQTMIDRLGEDLDRRPAGTHSERIATGYITLRANRILQDSAQEADRLGDDFIGTEHMLLAVASERSGTTGQIMAESKIDHETIAEALVKSRDEEHVFSDRAAGIRASLETTPQSGSALVNPTTLLAPRGFSHGIVTTGGRTLYLAGQTALDAEGNLVAPGDVVGQYHRVLANLWAVVSEAGGLMDNIVKMTIFVKDRDDYKAHLKELGEVHKEFFGSHYPATALVEVSRFFDDGVLVEIEGIAVL